VGCSRLLHCCLVKFMWLQDILCLECCRNVQEVLGGFMFLEASVGVLSLFYEFVGSPMIL
jgi:hypothetical protein